MPILMVICLFSIWLGAAALAGWYGAAKAPP